MATPAKTKATKATSKNLKFSRRQKWRRNPIPWALLLVISLAIAGIWVVPNYLDWSEQKGKITEFTSQNQQLEQQIDTQKKIRNKEQDNFDQLAKEELTKEAQRFPEKINTNQVARVLEIYALQLNLSRKNYAALKSLSFSSARPAESGSYYETMVTVSASLDRASLQRFINFLQTSEYSQQLTVETISPENKGETAALEFLDNNRLPLLNIRSINMTEDKKNAEDFPRTVYSIQLQVALFSQFE